VQRGARAGPGDRAALRGHAAPHRPARRVVQRAAAGDSQQGLGDGVGGRRRLLSHLQPGHLGDERQRRRAEHQAARPDHAAQHPGHEDAQRDALRARPHRRGHGEE